VSAGPLYVREAGAGAPILLLHGWGCHGGFFPKQFAELGRDFHLLAPDLPGHGRTGTGGPPLSIEAAADTCAELLEKRGLDRVLLVGWSMGALVAWSMLARHGFGRIAGLAVVDMSPRPLNDAGWRLGLRDGLDLARSDRAAAAMPGAWPAFSEHIVQALFPRDLPRDEELAAWARAEIARSDPTAMAAMWRSLVAQDFRAAVPRMACPTLLAYGGRSALYRPGVFSWIADQSPMARIVCFQHSGHAPHLTEAAAFNDAICAFRRQL
jgi:pimeloyl-[acyl-carrier protein] methyl ester esterase